MPTAATTRKRNKEHRDQVASLEYRLDRAVKNYENEQQLHARTRAQQQGFREGVEFAIRAMIREKTNWRGSES